ncbi:MULTISPECIES: type II toxin-antitoxin system death-on-curing family toxin [unclassified Methylobacterium]|uniref:type II toxin-antitoxin system death-on-curing family toxin n=1 Tax=unclassified Methylobacterium TaxID=2615210 RepID=UPI0011C1F4C3|nr:MULTISPECIES: type II toxin-antitoxin system death-on-curing family toxin [unclassified Methylobacterium]QEE40040.1 type II toxin-antitoxin system death-on-curing family toxin [Methylobacterium sp. WL1]TXN58601.1 type II toxin-antitoxin system death-on-curing family toxin [Methylobacterium sp. WL2]
MIENRTDDEPEWLTTADVINAHAKQLRIFGGASGIRDPGALESALGRPINRWRYEGTKLPELAAAYAFDIVRNHPFVDGNKRAGFLAMLGFLLLNNVRFAPDQAEATAIILGLAAGEIDESGLTRWIRDNWPAG